jgi:hypothetical protein
MAEKFNMADLLLFKKKGQKALFFCLKDHQGRFIKLEMSGKQVCPIKL